MMEGPERQEEKKTQSVEGCIRFWEAMLFHNRAFLPPATVVLIEATIKHLKGEAD